MFFRNILGVPAYGRNFALYSNTKSVCLTSKPIQNYGNISYQNAQGSHRPQLPRDKACGVQVAAADLPSSEGG